MVLQVVGTISRKDLMGLTVVYTLYNNVYVVAGGGDDLPPGPDGFNQVLYFIMSMVLQVVGTISRKDLMGFAAVYILYNAYVVAGGGNDLPQGPDGLRCGLYFI
jgi:hypothetical protein